MASELGFRRVFDKDIRQIIGKALRMTMQNPRYAGFFLRTIQRQNKASKRRFENLRIGISVPALAIVSITSRCNLKCAGCYHNTLRTTSGAEISEQRFDKLLHEAHQLGIGVVMLAGGEPLVRRELLQVATRHQDILFPIFTNGMLFDDLYLKMFKEHKHLFPLVSIEGSETITDTRRGDGIFETVLKTMRVLRDKEVFWGISVTLTSENLNHVTDEDFICDYISKGCRVFVYVEYVPVAENTRHLVVSEPERREYLTRIRDYDQRYPTLFLNLPGEESSYGGCLAAGRGFVHIGPDGVVEPCPFAPYSDTEILGGTLEEALKSRLMHRIRRHHAELTESSGGCALWDKKDWVEDLKKP